MFVKDLLIKGTGELIIVCKGFLIKGTGELIIVCKGSTWQIRKQELLKSSSALMISLRNNVY